MPAAASSRGYFFGTVYNDIPICGAWNPLLYIISRARACACARARFGIVFNDIRSLIDHAIHSRSYRSMSIFKSRTNTGHNR